MERCCVIEPRSAYYRFRLGELHANQGRLGAAISELTAATDLAPDDAYYHVRLGGLYSQVGRPQEAASALVAAIALSPQNASYHCLLADAYVRLGADRNALKHYREAGLLGDYDAAFVAKVRRMVPF